MKTIFILFSLLFSGPVLGSQQEKIDNKQQKDRIRPDIVIVYLDMRRHPLVHQVGTVYSLGFIHGVMSQPEFCRGMHLC